MDKTIEGTMINRLEDFIALAKEGKPVELEVNLKKEMVSLEMQDEGSEKLHGETDTYLLMAEYTQTGVEGRVPSVTKIYAQRLSVKTMGEAQVIKHIANERLKMDYNRLRNAGIIFEEKLF